MNLIYKVEQSNLNINNILKNELHISNRLFYKLINNKLVYKNDHLCDTRDIAQIGDIIKIELNYKEDNSNIIPTKMDLNIIYEDDYLLILNKPKGLAVHPSILHFDDTLSNGVKYYFDKIGLHKKIRPVNRLDLNTSGLIVFAKNEYIQESLIKQMSNNTFKKEYLAIVTGYLENKTGTIKKSIARKEGSIIERCISENGKIAITNYKVLNEYNNFSLVKCILETGRTHQIRVHFASIGHPLLGDELYGEKSDFLCGHALVCNKLSFIHPITNKQLEFTLENAIKNFEELF